MPIHIDRFSGSIIDLKPKQRDAKNALLILLKDPRVSAFDMSEKAWVRGLIQGLEHNGHIKEKESSYPWLEYEITEAGNKFVKS